MIRIGEFNDLEVTEVSRDGVRFNGEEEGVIWMPSKLAPAGIRAGQTLPVFVYYDSEDRVVATTEAPYVTAYEFAFLEVIGLTAAGVSLDWGLHKDLFLPQREQTHRLSLAEWVMVYVYINDRGRITASMRLEDHVDPEPGNYRVGDRVDLLVYRQTDLGFNCIIENRHIGVLYGNEVFSPIRLGDRFYGYIKKIREDGKIDLIQTQTGHRAAGDIGEEISSTLAKAGGFLPVNDKTSAEEIYDLFGVSKKKFKMAVGGLLKSGTVRFEKDGIQLNN